MGNFLITFGIVLIVLGLLLNLFGASGVPRLPGDILIQRGNFTFYFPIVTCLAVSIVLTLLSNILRR